MCDNNAALKDTLRRHKEAVHEGVKYKCTICRKEMTAKANLTRHIQTAHEAKEFLFQYL